MSVPGPPSWLTGYDHDDVIKQALSAILGGKSRPIRTIHRRARVHEVTLSDGQNIQVVYDRAAGEVTKVIYESLPVDGRSYRHGR
jgi:hypothetical protein